MCYIIKTIFEEKYMIIIITIYIIVHYIIIAVAVAVY